MYKKTIRAISALLLVAMLVVPIFAAVNSYAESTRNGITLQVAATGVSDSASAYAYASDATFLSVTISIYDDAGRCITSATDNGTNEAWAEAFGGSQVSYAIGDCFGTIGGDTKFGPSLPAIFD